MSTRLEFIRCILEEDEINTSELKEITEISKNNDLLRNILNTYHKYISNYKSLDVEPNYKFHHNTLYYINDLLNEKQYINYDNLLGKIRKIKKEVDGLVKYKKDLKIFNDSAKILINDLNHINTSIETLIINKMQENFNDNKYDFLEHIINNVQLKQPVEYILSLYPHYVNTRNENKEHIIINVIDKYLNEVIIEDNKNINKILYYDNLIDLFIKNKRFKINDTDESKIISMINNALIKSKNKSNDSKKAIFRIKELENKILNEYDYKQEHLKDLNYKYGVDVGFSDEVINEIPQIILQHKNYKNFEISDKIITIDDETTLDMDDAFSIKKLSNGNYILKVYISDVASTIKEYSLLDLEAYKRCSTIYLSDNTIPMFPFELSNDLLSLNSNGNKKVIEYEFIIDKNGEIINYEIKNNNIYPTNKLSYKFVNRIFENGIDDYELSETINNLVEIAYLLKNKNNKKDGYRKIEDLKLKVTGQNIEKNEYEKRTNSEIIVEELMILTNQITAKTFTDRALPFIYRVHPSIKQTNYYPELERLKKIINEEYDDNNKEFLKLIDTFLKMYPTSYYSKNNIGHYGLNINEYSHATSPVRRYSDVVIQRLIHDLILSNPTVKKIDYWDKNLDDIIKNINDKEEIIESYQHEYEKSKNKVKIKGRE